MARNLTQKRGLEDHWQEKGSAIEAHWGGCRENTFLGLGFESSQNKQIFSQVFAWKYVLKGSW
jgi:hypothetical protein